MSLHEGNLYMESKGIGHGCTFTLELPIFMSLSSLLTPPFSDNYSNQEYTNIEQSTNDIECNNNISIADDVVSVHHINIDCSSKLNVCNSITDQCMNSDIVSNLLQIKEDAAPSSNRNMRVLVVDDVTMNRKMIIRCIQGKYSLISEAEDGVIAVQAVADAEAEGHPYDLILLDYQMPNMIGPVAAKIMRSKGFDGLIIGVTGNGLQPDVDFFLSHGVDKVLIKPINTDQLNDCVEGNATLKLYYHYNDNTLYIL